MQFSTIILSAAVFAGLSLASPVNSPVAGNANGLNDRQVPPPFGGTCGAGDAVRLPFLVPPLATTALHDPSRFEILDNLSLTDSGTGLLLRHPRSQPGRLQSVRFGAEVLQHRLWRCEYCPLPHRSPGRTRQVSERRETILRWKLIQKRVGCLGLFYARPVMRAILV